MLDALKAADAGADQNAGARALVLGFGFPARIGDRLIGGRHRINDEIVDLALLLWLHPIVGIELARRRASRNEAADLAGDIGYVELGDPPGAVLARKQI